MFFALALCLTLLPVTAMPAKAEGNTRTYVPANDIPDESKQTLVNGRKYLLATKKMDRDVDEETGEESWTQGSDPVQTYIMGWEERDGSRQVNGRPVQIKEGKITIDPSVYANCLWTVSTVGNEYFNLSNGEYFVTTSGVTNAPEADRNWKMADRNSVINDDQYWLTYNPDNGLFEVKKDPHQGGVSAQPIYFYEAVYSITDNTAQGAHGSLAISKKDTIRGGDQISITVKPEKTGSEEYQLKSLTVDGTDVTKDVKNNQYTFNFPEKDIAVSAEFEKASHVPVTEPTIETMQLVLGKQIGIYFFLRLPQGAEAGTMNFSIACEKGTPRLVENVSGVREADGSYRYLCGLSSVEMAEPVTVTYNGKTVATTSVETYLEMILTNSEYAVAQDLAKAIYDYGYYAKQAFENGNGIKHRDFTYHDNQPFTKAANMPVPAKDKYKVKDELKGIKGTTFSLELDSETAMNFYVTTNTPLTKENVKVGSGVDLRVTPVANIANRYKIQLTGIDAGELADTFTVTLPGSLGKIGAPALAYVQIYLNSGTKEEMKNVCKALYNYYVKAAQYRQ